MSTERWVWLSAACAAILAGQQVWRKVAFPLLRAIWRAVHRVNAMADQMLGDRAKGIPSVVDRLVAVETAQKIAAELAIEQAHKLSEHVAWHSPPTNGPRPARQARPPSAEETAYRGRTSQ